MELPVAPVFQLCEVPPLTERVTELPRQIVWLGVTVVVKLGRTVTVTVSVLEHLPLSLLVTVYVVVSEGVTVIELVVSPVFQAREVPPVDVSVTLWPWQIVVSRLMVVLT